MNKTEDPSIVDEEEVVEYEDELEPCPVCDGYGMRLGRMGKRIHYRCRYCGIEWSSSVDE